MKNSSMGEPNKLTSHGIKEGKKRVALNLASGGGIGVGIVFIGGALVTATLVSALTVGRRLLKSRNSKNRNHSHSTGSSETLEMFMAEDTSTNTDEIKGLLPFPTDSFPDKHRNLSNGTVKTSVTVTDTSGMISSKSFFKEEKQNLELYSGKGDVICDDKEILPASGLHGSDRRRQCDGSVVNTEQFSLPVVEDQTHFQPANMNKDPYGGEIEIIEEESTIEIPHVDHRTEEDSQLMQVNNDQKVREAKCKEAAETTEADQSALIMLQSSEGQESTLIYHDQDSNSRGCLPLKSGVSVDMGGKQPLLYNSSLCKDEKLKFKCEEGSQAFETAETLEGAEALKAVHVDRGHVNGMKLMMEEKEKNCNQREVWLITESAEQQKRDETHEAAHADQDKVNGVILMFEEEKICSQHDGSLIVHPDEILTSREKLDSGHGDEGNSGLLIVPTAEVLKRDDSLDADGGYPSTVITTRETEQKYDQRDGLTMENVRGLEEDKALEPAQGKDKTEILMLEKKVSAPHDDENDAAGEAANIEVAIDSVSNSDLKKQLTEEQENPPVDSQEDHFVSDMITFENVTSESSAALNPNPGLESPQGVSSRFEGGSGFRNNLKEIVLLVEAIETRKENVSSETATKGSEDRIIESDINPLKQSIVIALEEIKDTPATTEADNMGVTGQMAMNEEDSVDDDTDQANITDKVEENSEGRGDSSAEYNTEPIWPAESLEELSMDLELKFDNQTQNQQPEETKTLQTEEKFYSNDVRDRGISVESLQNVNEGKNNMLDLTGQNDQQTNSLKPRIMDLKWIFMVFLWPFCFWYFDLPYFKISLIVILVVLLSKI